MAFVLYRSSAGSGKTYTLVKEYLKLVLTDADKFKHILGVTFTNKAAGEMKDRILQALKKLAKNEDKDLEKHLLEELPDLHNLDKTSAKLLTLLLHNYSDFAIMTIDSFIHRVIKAFALEIGLPLNFGIDLNLDKIQTYVVEQLMFEIGKNPFITEIILEFVFDRINQEKSWNIETEIQRFEKELFNEKNIDWVRAITNAFDISAFNEYKLQLQKMRDDFIDELNKKGRTALSLIANAGLTIDDFAYKKSGAAGFLQKCAELKRGDIKDFKMSARFQGEVWSVKSTPRDIESAIQTLRENGLDDLHDAIITFYDSKRSEAVSAAFVLDNIYLSAIIRHLIELVDMYKKENNVIPISEFNVKVYEIVKNSPVPFIYAILGEKFNHYLVDEFQDTSRLQFENLYPLIENALGSNYFNMAVGDAKQSIYRWRGGDMEIMVNEIPNRILPEQLKLKPLSTNYRSLDNILDFNNGFFTALSNFYKEEEIKNLSKDDSYKDELFGKVYNEVSQKTRKKVGGMVSLLFLKKPELNDKSEADEEQETLADMEEEPDNIVPQEVKAIIDSCIARGYEYSDIAILVRENRKGQEVAEYLLQQNIHVVSPDSLSMYRIPVIGFMIDVLTYITNRTHRIPLVSMLFFLGLNQKENPVEPTEIVQSIGDNSWWDLMPELQAFNNTKKGLMRIPVYEVVEKIIRIFGLSEKLDFETAGYLQAFLDIVAQYSRENSVDIASFLDWWEEEKERFAVVIPESKPAVKIMTIHKAKGLEFPVVIIPYTGWEHQVDKQLWLKAKPPVPTRPPLDFPMPVNKSIALEESFFKDEFLREKRKVTIDNINMLYVAFTRAREQLHIICEIKEKNENYIRLRELAVPLMKQDELRSDRFVFGDTLSMKEKELAKTKMEKIQFMEEKRIVFGEWDRRITIRRKAAEFWRFNKEYKTLRRARGILIHRVLSKIRTIDDIDRAFAEIHASGDMDKKEIETLYKQVQEIFQNKIVRKWFTPGAADRVFIETPIYTPDEVLRPDRVIISGDVVTLIDFKTGDPKDEGAHNQYVEQMKGYVNALRAMDYSGIEAHLYYIDSDRLETINEDKK